MESILGTLNFILSIIIGLLLLVVLVVVHELGHAIVARRNGVVVEEFGIGFPPRAWAKKLKNGIVFTLNWLPLGGFVKLKGESDDAKGLGTYGAASLWVKAKILLAGVAVNWLMAAAIFTILALFGLPKVLPDQFSVPSDSTVTRQPVVAANVGSGSPAAKAGIAAGDQLMALAGSQINTPAQLVELARRNAGKTVTVVYRQKGQERAADITLNAKNENNKGILGVSPAQQEQARATWSAPIVGVVVTAQFTKVTLQELGKMFANLGVGIASKFSGDATTRQQGQAALDQAGSGVSGPVGIFGSVFPRARQAGLTVLLLITGLISLSLAIMNVLPIPALDGGRLFVSLLFRLLRKPLSKQTEERIHGTGMLVLLGLVALVTVLDIGKLSGGQ